MMLVGLMVGLLLAPALPPKRCPTCAGTRWGITAALEWTCLHCDFVEGR